MELSILIAAWNEGSALLRTVASCHAACADMDHEIIVVDDGSTDQTGDALAQQYPEVRLLRNGEPTGTSAPKAQAAEHAVGKTLVFLDAHCRLDPPALQRLLKGIALTDGQAILVPRVAAVDPHSWEVHSGMLHGLARLNLRSFDFEGVRKRALPSRAPFLETSALAGICCAMRRSLYDALGGFDPGAPGRALEDVDLGLRAWLWGSAVLCDPGAVVGHWSRDDNRARYDSVQTLANKIRLARKNFSEPVWQSWMRQLQASQPTGLEAALGLFDRSRPSAEAWNSLNLARRRHDEPWFAEKFSLEWPRAER